MAEIIYYLNISSNVPLYSEAGHEVFAVGVSPKDLAALDPPHHHVVEDTGRIQARPTWHRHETPFLTRGGPPDSLGMAEIIYYLNISSNVPLYFDVPL